MNWVADPGEALPMTPELQQALAGLHDLQLAVAESAAPLPPLLAGGLLGIAAIAALLVLAWSRRPRQRYRRQLRRLAKKYRAAPADEGAAPSRLVFGLAALLRQVGLATQPAMPAGLAGEAWLRWLDARAPVADRGAFVTGVGRELAVRPYVAADRAGVLAAPQVAALIALVDRWLRNNA